MSLIGLDIGTTGAKAVAFDAAGRQLARAYREYPLQAPQPGWLELDPAEVLAAIRSVLGKVASQLSDDPPKAIAFSTLGEAVLPVDEHGRPLANGIIGFDRRGSDACQRLRGQLDTLAVYRVTGHGINSYHTLMKILHWREHQPELFKQARKFLCFGDFVTAGLGLPPAIDHSMAARTLMFDVNRRDWSDWLLDLAGLEPERLAAPAPPGQAVGRASENDLNLPKGCLVAAGLHDQPAGILGAAVKPGEAMYAIGTVICLGVRLAADQAPDPNIMLANNLCRYPTFGDGWASLAWNFTGGSILRWFRDELAKDLVAEAQAAGADPYDLICKQLPDEPTRLLVLPHFTMAGTPWLDPHARGAILGLQVTTSRAELAKALMEGAIYEIRLNLERLQEAGVRVESLLAVGGAAKSPAWMQLSADILGRPIKVLQVTECAARGAALLAGYACGVIDDPQAAAAEAVKVARVWEPRPPRQRQYDERFGEYRDLYAKLRDVMHRIGRWSDFLEGR